jgi:hypothetical protein
MLIIGIDPGGTTGVVLIRPATDNIDVFTHMHLDGLHATQWVEAELTSHPDEDYVVVVEQFTISPRTLTASRAGSMEALYTVGSVRYVCFRHQTPIILQTPSAAKNAINDEVLKDLDLWSKVSGPHERDALRHALLYSRTQRLWQGVLA